ncbi:hypothetical protein VNO78_21636 [Psophocarpus tetragonolobus]|uniref:Uncharacterized protein n=1 Tax=Psophocarpus tetragonolobus TaxID=3891 RepID=A0AAN9SDL7_PSOTE
MTSEIEIASSSLTRPDAGSRYVVLMLMDLLVHATVRCRMMNVELVYFGKLMLLLSAGMCSSRVSLLLCCCMLVYVVYWCMLVLAGVCSGFGAKLLCVELMCADICCVLN